MLGQDLLLTMSDYIQFSIESDYEAALKFFKVFGDKMERVNPVPVVKFFFYVHGQVSSCTVITQYNFHFLIMLHHLQGKRKISRGVYCSARSTSCSEKNVG